MAESRTQVTLAKVLKRYGGVTALHEINLEIMQGEFMTLLGPSGCGKTTTLRLIAGFIEPTAGTILLGGEDVTHLPPYRREIGMVFQDYALFPHMSVRDNIGFALAERGRPKAEIDRRVDALLDLIRLPGIAERYPAELSGGQAQRVAFARAIGHPPRVLLMDEPLAALDLKLREAMQIELRRLQRASGITTVFVTHDQTEAMTMSDRIAVMNNGRIEQIGTPEHIYANPATRFVAGFVGQTNMIEAKVLASSAGTATVAMLGGRTFGLPDPFGLAAGERCAVSIRPESLHLIAPGDPAYAAGRGHAIEGVVRDRIFTGSTLKLTIDMADGQQLLMEDKPQDIADGIPGAQVRVGFALADARLLRWDDATA